MTWQAPPHPDPADASQWQGNGKGSEKQQKNGKHYSHDQQRKADGHDKSRTPLPLVWADKIEPITQTRDFVEGLLLENSAIVVYGQANSGKTFWFTDLSLSIAASLTWNGREIEQGGVVYAVLEGGDGFRNRVAAWKREHGLEGVKLPFAAIPASINLLDPAADTPKLIETIKAAATMIDVPVKLVVIDTLSRALAGGNENSPEDMGALVRNMDLIRAETGAAVAFVHHSGKDQARGMRGHTVLHGATDTEIETVDNNGDRTATVVKQRDLPKGDVFGFRLKVVELGINKRGKPVTSCAVEHSEAAATRSKGKGRPLSANTETLLQHIDYLANGPDVPTTRVQPDMPPVKAISRETLRQHLLTQGWFVADVDWLGKSKGFSKRGRNKETNSLNTLKSRRVVGFNAEYVWPT